MMAHFRGKQLVPVNVKQMDNIKGSVIIPASVHIKVARYLLPPTENSTFSIFLCFSSACCQYRIACVISSVEANGFMWHVLLPQPAVSMPRLCFKDACPPIISWMWSSSLFQAAGNKLVMSFCPVHWHSPVAKVSESFAFSYFVELKFPKKFFFFRFSSVATQYSRITKWKLNFRFLLCISFLLLSKIVALTWVFRLCCCIWTSAVRAPPFLLTFMKCFYISNGVHLG